MADLELKAIRKSFGQHEIIKGVDISIEHGEFVVFVGPSGCGKSTLLRLIAGLEEITSGTLDIGGRCVNDLPPKERSIAMVFQSYALFPHMTVFENMAFGLSLAGEKKDVIDSKVSSASGDFTKLHEASMFDLHSLANGAILGAETHWRSGACVRIDASSPGKVKPGTVSDIDVKTYSKVDGGDFGRFAYSFK